MNRRSSLPHRTVIFAPFFSLDGPSRPRAAAEALAELMPVDVITADFDHARKVRREPRQSQQFAQIIYLKTPPYKNNVSFARFVSHIVFSLKAASYFFRNRRAYDTIYATVPFNLLAGIVFSWAGSAKKIMDVVDIWPDALPFPSTARWVLAPLFWAWKWLFTSSAGRADIILSGSDIFMQEARRYARKDVESARFYISHDRLYARVPKESVFTLAYVGNIGRLYDFETLLAALSNQQLRNEMQLFVIGAGDRQAWLLNELVRREIRHRFFGMVIDSDKLATILCGCHAGFNGYVQTNASFSYKATTYLAAGLPMVNSMQGDLRHLVATHDLGENYDSGNEQQLREALLRLSSRTLGQVEENCREFFRTRIETRRVHEELSRYLAKQLG